SQTAKSRIKSPKAKFSHPGASVQRKIPKLLSSPKRPTAKRVRPKRKRVRRVFKRRIPRFTDRRFHFGKDQPLLGAKCSQKRRVPKMPTKKPRRSSASIA